MFSGRGKEGRWETETLQYNNILQHKTLLHHQELSRKEWELAVQWVGNGSWGFKNSYPTHSNLCLQKAHPNLLLVIYLLLKKKFAEVIECTGQRYGLAKNVILSVLFFFLFFFNCLGDLISFAKLRMSWLIETIACLVVWQSLKLLIPLPQLHVHVFPKRLL